MSASDIVSAVIFFAFVALLVIGATTTVKRSLAYFRKGLKQPVLLPRDRDLILGLTIPFVAIGLSRLLDLRAVITDNAGDPQVWWILLTGLPPLYALARYDWFELFRIERDADGAEEDAP